MLGDKLRFRFAKTGSLRLLSHHDLMRCLERMLRRAELPFKFSAGFHPSPRIVFALSLPLGVVGLNEVVEIEFTQPCDADEVLDRLNRQVPQGLLFTAVSVVPMKATAMPRRVEYRMDIPADRIEHIEGRCRELLESQKIWVERQRPVPKRLNIRPYLLNVSISNRTLILDMWVTTTGTARAEELLRLLTIDDLLEAGTALERTWIALRDEPDQEIGDPPDGPADTQPLVTTIAPRAQDREQQPATAHWGLSPAGPVVE